MRLVIKEIFKVIPGEAKPEDPKFDPGAWYEEKNLGSEWETGEKAREQLIIDQAKKLKLVITKK